MYQLSEEHIETIRRRLSQGGLKNKGLQNELLDHYCCFIEEATSNGKDFETAYKEAYQAISPDGVYDIETELFSLLTFNKQTRMKRALYISGFLTAFFFSLSYVTSALGWETFYIVNFIGELSLLIAVGIIFTGTIKQFRQHSFWYKVRIFSGVIAGTLNSIAAMLQILGYEWAKALGITGLLLFGLVFIPMYCYQLSVKDKANGTTYGTLLFGGSFVTIATIMNMLHWQGSGIPSAMGLIFFFALACTVLIKAAKNFRKHPINLNLRIIAGFIASTLLIMAGVLVIAGAVAVSKAIGITAMCIIACIFLPMYFYQQYQKTLSAA